MASDGSSGASAPVENKLAERQQDTIREMRREIVHLRQQVTDGGASAERQRVMIREGNHRIKNSLQLVASLIRLQARRESGPAARLALNSAAERVGTVAAIHDALQETEGRDRIDLGATLRKICSLLQTMVADDGHFDILLEAEPLELPVDLAQPLVLAVNELVVNSLRHAFTGRKTGVVQVTLSRSDAGLVVSVADDGNGLPDGYAAGQGYGLGLVAMLVKKIGGEIRTECQSGARFTISAPLVRDAA